MEIFGLTVGLPIGVAVVGMSALLSLYATHLSDEELCAEVLGFVHRLGIACVVAPTVLVTVLAAASFAHSTTTVVVAFVNASTLSAVVTGIAWSPQGSPRPLAGQFRVPGTVPPHGSW